jgi:hypothetical protein
VAEVVGHLARNYTNRVTGQKVSVLLLCGRPGPMSVHTPEVCYQGSGYEIVGKQEKRQTKIEATGRTADLWTAQFKKPGIAPQPVRLFWGWGRGENWVASDQPRFTYARSRYLYKLYVTRSLSSSDDPVDKDPCLDFFQLLFPELQRCLSPGR